MTIPQGIIALQRPYGTKYHLGTLAGPAVNLPGYQAGNIIIRSHGWNQQWTDRTGPIVVNKSPAQIVAANRMFPYGDTGCRVETVANYTFKGPMDSAGIAKYMPSTGERPDIALITDPSALFMLTGNPSPMLAWAQAAGSCPLHFRDESTGRPIDLLKYPQANLADANGLQGQPWLDKGPPIPPSGTVYLADGVTLDKNAPGYSSGSNGYHAFPDDWTVQGAHFPEMSYVAYQATGDLGFLEDLQYEANLVIVANASLSTPAGAIISGELRGLSWAGRQLFMAHIATKDEEAKGPLPDYLHPSSYFKKLLDQSLAYYTSKYMDDPANQYFRLVSGGTRFAPWQVDYMLTAMAFGILSGHSDWAPFYLWALKNAIDRTSGKSGYPPGWGGAYYLNTCEWKKRGDGTYDQGDFDFTKPLDWAGTFLFQANDPNGRMPTDAEIASLKVDPLNGGQSITGQGYLMTTRAVLVMAKYLDNLGLLNVRATCPDLDTCLANADRMVRNYGSMNARVSVVLDASQAPGTIPPLPTNPKPQEISLTDLTKLRVGETKLLALTVTPADADLTGLAYRAEPDGIVTLEAQDKGVNVTRVAAGAVKIFADLNGLEAEGDAVDAAPLALSLTLAWAS